MYPDGYPAAILIKWETISVVDPLEPFVPPIDQFHPGVPLSREENGRLLDPIFLRAATFVKGLRYRHS